MESKDLDLLTQQQCEQIMGRISTDFPDYVGDFELFKIFSLASVNYSNFYHYYNL